MSKITMKGRIVDGKYFDEWYTRAVEESGYSHDSYSWKFVSERPDEFNPEDLSAYVIKHKGKRLEPEEIISRLQRLAELEGG